MMPPERPPFIADTSGAELVDYEAPVERDGRLTAIAYTVLGCFVVAVWIAAGAGVYWQGKFWGFW